MQPTDVVLLHLADVTVQRAVSKQNQHDRTGSLLDGRNNMSWMSHHSILVLGTWTEEDPGLVLDVENPQLAGDVSCGVNLSSVHVDLPLVETNTNMWWNLGKKYSHSKKERDFFKGGLRDSPFVLQLSVVSKADCELRYSFYPLNEPKPGTVSQWWVSF